MNATRVMQNADPVAWQDHHYGLSTARWQFLEGKSFWVTGAGTGYGRSIACGLAAAGAQVFLTGRRIEKLQESIQEISSLGIHTGRCIPIAVDITDSLQVNRACETVRNHCSSLTGLINNAATSADLCTKQPLQEGTLEDWNRVITTNVTAHWFLTKSMLPSMVKGGCVRVLFMSSLAGWASTAGFGLYNISKAALNSLSHSLAQECVAAYPDVDIQINLLAPGEARTEMNQGSMNSPYSLVSMVLLLLSHPSGGPNGRFFHQDGRHLPFGFTEPHRVPLT